MLTVEALVAKHGQKCFRGDDYVGPMVKLGKIEGGIKSGTKGKFTYAIHRRYDNGGQFSIIRSRPYATKSDAAEARLIASHTYQGQGLVVEFERD